jgi:hypothetical protein
LYLPAYDVMAVNRAALRVVEPIRWLVTYHPTDMISEDWPGLRRRFGGNDDYQIVLHRRNQWAERLYGDRVQYATHRPGRTGSSALLGVFHGIHLGYTNITLAGCPLVEGYATFQGGWESARDELAAVKTRSLSGWTKTFLEGLQCNA